MDFLTFAIERYNYWIFITLMMMGLYIVIARGNLIKKMIGLNVFQTSVFIYYISIGKIVGGTAPIYTPEDLERRTHDAHGAEALPGKDPLGQGAIHADETLHDGFGLAGNDLSSLTGGAHSAAPAEAIHSAPVDSANELLASPTFSVEEPPAPVSDAAHAVADIIYSNPLPHVLILTAIVVGIATTAVGLALIVRIREAYGTIEEDELQSADEVAEFGSAPALAGAGA
jgi:multicomponent Na+:H+ antiporter subunit C